MCNGMLNTRKVGETKQEKVGTERLEKREVPFHEQNKIRKFVLSDISLKKTTVKRKIG